MRRVLSALSPLKASAVLIIASALAPCLASAAGARNSQTDRAAGSEASARVEQAKASGEFRTAAGTPAEAPAAFEFESSGFSYHVAANGNGRRTKGDKTRRYSVHLGAGESIRRLHFSEYEDDLLLIFEVEGGEAGPSVVLTRLEQPSMRSLWQQRAPSDGVDALRRGGSLYLGGAGFVARLELKNGAYAWQHRDGREEEAAEGGDDREGGIKESDVEGRENDDEALIPHGRYVPAEVSGDTAVFGPAQGDAGRATKTVRVNRKTGKIISVE